MEKISPFLLPIILCFAATLFLTAQETRFFMPREIAEAYKNGTRSYDGRPGPKYWQNTVDYQIEVEVLIPEKKLQGTQTAIYHNNSPNSLTHLVVRLYYDAFRKANPRATRVSPSDITEGVELSELEINGESYDVSNSQQLRRNGTNMTIPLNEALKPGEKLELKVAWTQQIPETTIRAGAYDSTAFFVAYWYPQIGVYDDVFGWDNLAYDFSAEFYNNLANFDVRITVPENFTVLATGVLQNAGEVLAPASYERYQKAKTSVESVMIVSPEDLEENFRHKSGTWHYRADEVSDFSFCLSDHFAWDAAVQQVDGRQVLTNSFYPANIAADCKEVTPNQQKTMKYFSEGVPGVPYPYPEFTTFISSTRGGGMETPMMANNGGPGLGVTVHEMFHTYFPMYVRINEKRYAWMDEGWANFTTALVIQRYFRDNDDLLFGNVSGGIGSTLGTTRDLPLITSTQYTDNTNYGYSAYPLPAFLYSVLHHHLGEELFLRCYREYIRRWAKRSPTPYDFFYTFENVSGQDLSWFWKPWFFEYGTADLSIKSFRKGNLILENLGNRPVPVTVRVDYTDGQSEQLTASAQVWKNGHTYQMKIPKAKEVNSLRVNVDIPDAELLNNYFPPLQDQYAKYDISDNITGAYNIPNFGAVAKVSRKNGILQLEITPFGLHYYLVPSAENEFKSPDGEITFNFLVEEGVYKEVAFKISDFDVKGVKQ
jgi:hypothetical protein